MAKVALTCDANTSGAACRVWQGDNETATQNLAAATFMVRFKITAQSGTSEVQIVTKGAGQWAVQRKSGSATVYQVVGGTVGGGSYAIDFTPTVDTWHTLLWTLDAALGSDRQKLYLDGVAGGTANAAGNTANPGTNDRIQIGPTDGGINVRHDELCVWDRVLTGTEITDLVTMRAVDAAASGRLLNYSYTGTAGTNVTTGDAGLDDISGNGEPSLVTFSGTPTWQGDDPFVVPAPSLSLKIKGVELAAGGSTDLGTWPVGDDVALRVRLSNDGDADLVVTSAAVTGDGTLVTTDLVDTYASGDLAFAVITLENGSAGTGKSLTFTVESDDPDNPSYAVTLTYDVREDSDRTLAPHVSATATAGSGFSDNGGSGVAIPTASGTPHGSGFDSYKPAVAADIDGIDWVDGTSLYLCVCTDTSDIGDIDSVVFYHEGETKTIYTKALSPRTGVEGFLVQLTASSARTSDVYWKVIPVNGLEVVGTCRVYFNTDGSLYGDTTTISPGTNPCETIAAASGGDRIRLNAGTYTWADAGSNFYPDVPVIIEPAPGVSAGEVIITQAARGLLTHRPSKSVFRNIAFDTATIVGHVGLGNNAGNDPRAGTKFEGCRFIDSNGVTGPSRGYTTLDGSTQQVYFKHDRNQPYYCEDCIFETYNGACGATCVVNSDITMSFDALYVGHSAATGHLYGNLDITEGGRFKQRQHVDQTLTVTSDSGTGPTVLTFSGAGTIADGMTSDNGAILEFLTGALAGQTFNVTASDDAAETITVSGDASGAANGDTCWCYVYAHPNVIQMADSSNPDGVILTRIRAAIDYTEPFRIDRLDTATDVEGVWFQASAIVLSEGAGSGNVAAWEADQKNCGFRQVTCLRSFVPEVPSPADTAAFDVNACAMYDSVFNAVAGSPGSLTTDQAKFRFDDNHFVTGSTLGSAATGPADATIDSLGRPTAGSPLLTRLYAPRLRYDAYGEAVEVDGTGAIGGAQPDPGGGGSAGARAAKRFRLLRPVSA